MHLPTQQLPYTLHVTSASGLTGSDSVKIIVNPFRAIISPEDLYENCGTLVDLYASSNLLRDTTGFLYNWYPAEGLSNPHAYNPTFYISKKTKYFVEITTPNGCKAIDSVVVYPFPSNYPPEICMVTVDDNFHNELVWQRGPETTIDSFYIYRESSTQTNQYDLIGKVPNTTSGSFVDNSSNARVHSNKYALAIKDICGFFSDIGAPHKTIHLNINKGQDNSWNLIWEKYEGFDVGSYRIYRGTSPDNLTLIGSTSGSNSSYTDFSAPLGNIYFQIWIIRIILTPIPIFPIR